VIYSRAGEFMRIALTHIQRIHSSSFLTLNKFKLPSLCFPCLQRPSLDRALRLVAPQSCGNKMSTLANRVTSMDEVKSALAVPGGAPLRVKNSLSKEKVNLAF